MYGGIGPGLQVTIMHMGMGAMPMITGTINHAKSVYKRKMDSYRHSGEFEREINKTNKNKELLHM
jgi:hypothetical protein